MNPRIVMLVLVVVLLGSAGTAPAQTTEELNLGFEQRGDTPLLPKAWTVSGDGFKTNAPGYQVGLDLGEAKSGKRSLRMKSTGQGSFGNAYLTLPGKVAAGKRIKISGWIKTKDVAAPGYAGLWCRVDGPAGMLAHDNMVVRVGAKGEVTRDDRGVRGTTDWKLYSVEHDVPPSATAVVFGSILVGEGTAWWDDFAVEVGGQPYQGKPLAELAAERQPKPAELQWLRENAFAFRTEEAGSGFDDLQPLKEAVGLAHIVALGEATHGTAEFFKMKHRLTEFLATEMGFTVFAIEASMPEAFRLNDYVLRGEGDPKELLKGMYFWTWNTQEVLDMILWMRAFNASGKGRIEFLGFDMQEPKVAAENVRTFVTKADPDYLKTFEEAYAGLKSVAELRRELAPAWARQGGKAPEVLDVLAAGKRVAKLAEDAGAVLKHLEQERDRLVAEGDPEGVDWAIQNARIVVQAVTLLTSPRDYRDRCMAENVDWILAHRPPGTKVVLWAHNGHVAKAPGAMGGFLSQRHGADMVVVGFAFHEGRYTAVARGAGLKANDAGPSEPGSVEWAFHQAGLPRAIIDLRKAEKASPGSGWLAEPVDHRMIGAVASGWGMTAAPYDLPASYDLLVFFDKSTASALLPPHRRD